ncbi:uracil-DNA glycosylase [Leeia oryzae]|uniref:uracil-DNA glycosylase n=1 Tax=Leeia oryzae TaxID=356662 RepID=UPI0003764FE2|nr:uracil-DNA glycosylase [Leeia oryzae]
MDEQLLKAMGLWPLWVPKDQETEVVTLSEPAASHEPSIASVHVASPFGFTESTPDVETPAAKPVISASAKAGLAAALAAARGGSSSLRHAPEKPATHVALPEAQQPPVQAEAPAPVSLVTKPVTPANDNWDDLTREIHQCRACTLCDSRTQAVPGIGDVQAEWMFIGEAPGAEEDRLGEPFVGTAGKLLDNMLAAMQLKRGDNVYIGNVLKCRPPGNRDPQPAEVAACRHFLTRQIALVQPKILVALGRFAANTLLNTDSTLASLRGTVHHVEGIPLIVTYHPAYLLRNLPDKAKAWQDLCLAMKTLQQTKH